MNDDMKARILRLVYSAFPFDVKGDASITSAATKSISCIIPTYARPADLDKILTCLEMQNFDRSEFDIIIIEDGESEATKAVAMQHSNSLSLQYLSTTTPVHSVGTLRNLGIASSVGRFILFLDDDTVILQTNFLSIITKIFHQKRDIDCVVIPGAADRCMLENHYSYLNKYSFGGACIAYRRDTLVKLGGFYSTMSSYEDIELAIRFTAIGGRSYRASDLTYFHPPAYFTTWAKPIMNGVSFARTLKRYSFPFWLICYLNSLRFLPLLLLSPFSYKHRHWSMISAGFLIGPFIGRIIDSRKLRYK
jgi:glycosyltransferase involved in cell wall biosynthesis